MIVFQILRTGILRRTENQAVNQAHTSSKSAHNIMLLDKNYKIYYNLNSTNSIFKTNGGLL